MNLDKTFCTAKCINVQCERNMKQIDEKLELWKNLSFDDFSDDCDEYMPYMEKRETNG